MNMKHPITPSSHSQFIGGGEMGECVVAKDWSTTPLGQLDSWPNNLRTTVSLALASNFPINIIWGPQHTQIYNNGYRVLCGAVHPRALGEAFTETWASAWSAIGDPFDRALQGEASFLENLRMFLERNGYLEETFFTFSLSPIRDDKGEIVGLFHPVTETTLAMLSQRRTKLFRELAENSSKTNTMVEAVEVIFDTLAEYPHDLPFARLYLIDEANPVAKLVGGLGIDEGGLASPKALNLDASSERGWPVGTALAGNTVSIQDFEARFGKLESGDYPEAIQNGFLLPLRSGNDKAPLGFFAVGASTRLPLDQAYLDFFEMLGVSVSTAVSNSRAYEHEKMRVRAIAELDLAKTSFFSNISHEFRTPLTLMLGPIDEVLGDKLDSLSAQHRVQIETLRRNSLRLFKLVNSLLDFSRLESGKMQAHFRPTDIVQTTRGLASAFDSAMKKAGIAFRVESENIEEPLFIDTDMWEKIIFNLLSNALKFTFAGEIKVKLSRMKNFCEIEVKDTGTGVPEKELPHLFERFHRVLCARSRSHEGSGIGLALVHELVVQHGGSIEVVSKQNIGTSFTVRIPFGSSHLPHDHVAATGTTHLSREIGDNLFIEEVDQWNPQNSEKLPNLAKANPEFSRILLVDDNADMRSYINRLLSPYYSVEEASNGLEALRSIERSLPDLILSDIMMPEMNGFQLLEKLKKDPKRKRIPLIFLSARAGEESTVEGLLLGADDYLVKPFSSGELVARVKTHLSLSSLRQELELEQRHLKARDEFLSIASHELKTPVCSLSLQVQRARREFNASNELAAPSVEKWKTMLGVFTRQTQRLERVIEDLLEVSRIRLAQFEINPVPTHLSNLITEVIQHYSTALSDAHCTLELKITPDIQGSFDQQKIEQVVVNLLSNVIKYAARSLVVISLSKTADGAVFSVQDFGLGIAPEKLPKIFDRFERAMDASSISGLGLGLYIVKEIVDKHSGSVHVQSVLGKGSTFTVVLPFLHP